MTAATSELVASLASDDAEKRLAAAEALARLETAAQPAAVALVEACAVADDASRDWVVTALEGVGPPAIADVGRLVKLAGRPELDVAYWAVTLLGRLNAQAAPAVPALVAALDAHADLAVRQRAAWALGQIGPAAAAAAASLESAAAGSDPRLASLAREALAHLAG